MKFDWAFAHGKHMTKNKAYQIIPYQFDLERAREEAHSILRAYTLRGCMINLTHAPDHRTSEEKLFYSQGFQKTNFRDSYYDVWNDDFKNLYIRQMIDSFEVPLCRVRITLNPAFSSTHLHVDRYIKPDPIYGCARF